MKTHIRTLITFLLVFGTSLFAQQQPPDPLGENFFPPELLMQNQKAIGLSEEQRNFLKAEIQKAQTRFTDLQWQLQNEIETMTSLAKQERVDEQQILSQLDKVLNVEREIKKIQMALVVHLKNKLTLEQLTQLREIKNKIQEMQNKMRKD